MQWKSTAYVTKKVKVSWLIIKGQVRKCFTEESLRELGNSMLTQGQFHPIGCLADGTLLWGERRVRAAILVGGLEELEARIYEKEPSESELVLIQTGENKHENLLPFELGSAIEHVSILNPTWTNGQLASAFSLTPTDITRLRTAFRSPVVVEALKAQKIGLGVGYTISKLPEGEQATALEKILTGGATRDQIERGRKPKNPNAVRMSKTKLVLPSGIQAVISGADLAIDDLIETFQNFLEATKKAAKEGLDVKTFAATMKCKATR